jgi:hypothetical protein
MTAKATIVVGVDGSPKTVVEWPGDSGGPVTFPRLSKLIYIDPGFTPAPATPNGSIAAPLLTSQDAINSYTSIVGIVQFVYGSEDPSAVNVDVGKGVAFPGIASVGDWTFAAGCFLLANSGNMQSLTASDGFSAYCQSFSPGTLTVGDDFNGNFIGLTAGSGWAIGASAALNFSGRTEINELNIGDGSTLVLAGKAEFDVDLSLGASCTMVSSGVLFAGQFGIGDATNVKHVGYAQFNGGEGGTAVTMGNGSRLHCAGEIGFGGTIDVSGPTAVILVRSQVNISQYIQGINGQPDTAVLLESCECQLLPITAGDVSLLNCRVGVDINVSADFEMNGGGMQAGAVNTSPGVFMRMKNVDLFSGVTLNNQDVAGSLIVDPWTHQRMVDYGVTVAFPARVVVAA